MYEVNDSSKISLLDSNAQQSGVKTLEDETKVNEKNNSHFKLPNLPTQKLKQISDICSTTANSSCNIADVTSIGEKSNCTLNETVDIADANISALERINQLVMRSVERTKRTAMSLSAENDISFLVHGISRSGVSNAYGTDLKGVGRRFSASTVRTFSSQVNANLGEELENVSVVGNGELNEMRSLNASSLTTPGRSAAATSIMSEKMNDLATNTNEPNKQVSLITKSI